MSVMITAMSCPSCGARLQIYPDMEHFACGYCGMAVFVERRGGVVMLKAVTEAIHKVQIGTDKTAAELAIVRLTQELAEKRNQIALVHSNLTSIPPAIRALLAFFGSLVVIALLVEDLATRLGFQDAGGFAMLCAFVLGTFLSTFVWWKSGSTQESRIRTTLRPLLLEAEQLQRRIVESQRIANS